MVVRGQAGADYVVRWNGFRFVAGLVAALMLASCGSRDVAGDEGDQAPVELWGRTFISLRVTEDGEPRPLVVDARVEVTFEEREDEGVVRWQAGCNMFGSKVEISEERLLVGEEIRGTEIGCREELQEQDKWLAEFFRSDPRWDLSNDWLTLTSRETTIELKEKGD